MKWVFNNLDVQMFGLKRTNLDNFHPLEVLGRGGDAQLQVSENLNFIYDIYYKHLKGQRKDKYSVRYI